MAAREVRDRKYKILQALAAAGDTGMLTTELVMMAGETPDTRTLTWFGSILRDQVASRRAYRGEKTKAGWQQPSVQRWHITAEGRQLVLEMQAERLRKQKKTRDEVAAIRRRQVAVREAQREYIPGTSGAAERQAAVLKMRDAGVEWKDITRLLHISEPTARKDYVQAQRIWPSPLYPARHVHVFGPDSERLPFIAGALAEEAGLTQVQVEGLIRVAWSLGIRLVIPYRFRVDRPDEDEDTESCEVDLRREAVADARRDENAAGANTAQGSEPGAA